MKRCKIRDDAITGVKQLCKLEDRIYKSEWLSEVGNKLNTGRKNSMLVVNLKCMIEDDILWLSWKVVKVKLRATSVALVGISRHVVEQWIREGRTIAARIRSRSVRCRRHDWRTCRRAVIKQCTCCFMRRQSRKWLQHLIGGMLLDYLKRLKNLAVVRGGTVWKRHC